MTRVSHSEHHSIPAEFTTLLDEAILPHLHATDYINGLTHTFYRYPARMYPGLARALIQNFSSANDYVLDPFMGGGTAVVEALACGRNVIGLDINAIANFITRVKTTPLSEYDEAEVVSGLCLTLDELETLGTLASWDGRKLRNVPSSAMPVFRGLLPRAESLYLPRQQRFARCVLLRLGQWALDSRVKSPSEANVVDTLHEYVYEMLDGLRELVEAAREHDIPKNQISKRRLLLERSVVGAERDPKLADVLGKPRLVITSPPYPGVHVLYHRWQVAGRRETPAPYWFIGAKDGNSASYYTMGSRTPFGLDTYFATLAAAFQSVRAIIHPDALVVQMVAFGDTAQQLPRFLAAMREAGFCELLPAMDRRGLWRSVPNRKWYNRTSGDRGPAEELLLFHRPCPAGVGG